MAKLEGVGYNTFVLGIFFGILSTLAVVGRMLTRLRRDTNFGFDELFLLVGLLSIWAYIGLVIWGINTDQADTNPDSPDFNPSKLQTFLKSLYYSVPIYFITVACIKFSFLFLYSRIFTLTSVRRTSTVTGVICGLWAIATIGSAFGYCVPNNHFWEPSSPGYCFNFDIWFIVLAVIEILIDVSIFILPFTVIAKLNLSIQKRVGLGLIFGLGLIIIATQIVRMKLLYQPNGSFVSFTQGSLWGFIHAGVGMLCASVPTYDILLQKLAHLPATNRAYGSQLVGRASHNRRDAMHLTTIAGGVGSHVDTGSLPANSIKVQHDVDVV